MTGYLERAPGRFRLVQELDVIDIVAFGGLFRLEPGAPEEQIDRFEVGGLGTLRQTCEAKVFAELLSYGMLHDGVLSYRMVGSGYIRPLIR